MNVMPSIPPAALTNFQRELSNLSVAMEQQLPNFPDQCRKINELLRQHPEITHLLKEEEIGTFMKAAIKESQVQFSLASTSGKSKIKDPLKGVNLSALNIGDIQL